MCLEQADLGHHGGWSASEVGGEMGTGRGCTPGRQLVITMHAQLSECWVVHALCACVVGSSRAGRRHAGQRAHLCQHAGSTHTSVELRQEWVATCSPGGRKQWAEGGRVKRATSCWWASGRGWYTCMVRRRCACTGKATSMITPATITVAAAIIATYSRSHHHRQAPAALGCIPAASPTLVDKQWRQHAAKHAEVHIRPQHWEGGEARVGSVVEQQAGQAGGGAEGAGHKAGPATRLHPGVIACKQSARSAWPAWFISIYVSAETALCRLDSTRPLSWAACMG